MPDEYKGFDMKERGQDISQPRWWTEQEEKWVMDMHQKGYSFEEIARGSDRTIASVRMKIKRYEKANDLYNVKHADTKKEINEAFLKHIRARTICDVYAGMVSTYGKPYIVVSNDINKKAQTDYNMDALMFLCKMYSENRKFDYIDLDPFGSAYDCFDLAIKMAKKGIAITFGELGNKRWGYIDFVKRRYNIDNIDDFNAEMMLKYVKMIANRNKKELNVYKIANWRNIARIWCKIKPIKLHKTTLSS